MQVLTTPEKLLLSSVGAFAVSLTAIVILCLVKKSCWLHKAIWDDGKVKKKKNKMDDVICIRYPPEIYPTSLGVLRERRNFGLIESIEWSIDVIRSPEEELARLFRSPLKRDSTYSSMSETSSSIEGGSGSNSTTASSPVTAPITSTPESPESANCTEECGTGSGSSSSNPTTTVTSPAPAGQDRRISLGQLAARHDMLTSLSTNRATVAALAAEAAVAANQRFSLQQSNQPATRHPFFTFILKYDEENGLVDMEFIEARNIPHKEYLKQPSDVFFTIEIMPKKVSDRRKEMMRYRFVTKTIKKAGEICDFSEKFLAQLAKSYLKEYIIRFSAFDQDRFGNPTEIGTTTLLFEDFKDFTTSKLVLSCSLKEPVMKRGDILMGLCYLPTAERMSVTVVKASNLNNLFGDATQTRQNICYVRLLLLKGDTGKIIKKKKTTFQKLSGTSACQPVFNETIVFDMPPTELAHAVLLVLVCLTDKPSTSRKSSETSKEALRPETLQSRHEGQGDSDALFHYEENLNKAKRSDSQGSNSSSHSQSSAASSSKAKPANRAGSKKSNGKSQKAEPVPEQMENNEVDNNAKFGTNKSVITKDSVVGKVSLGYNVKNPLGKYHWENMMKVPRNVVTEWHNLK